MIQTYFSTLAIDVFWTHGSYTTEIMKKKIPCWYLLIYWDRCYWIFNNTLHNWWFISFDMVSKEPNHTMVLNCMNSRLYWLPFTNVTRNISVWGIGIPALHLSLGNILFRKCVVAVLINLLKEYFGKLLIKWTLKPLDTKSLELSSPFDWVFPQKNILAQGFEEIYVLGKARPRLEWSHHIQVSSRIRWCTAPLGACECVPRTRAVTTAIMESRTSGGSDEARMHPILPISDPLQQHITTGAVRTSLQALMNGPERRTHAPESNESRRRREINDRKLVCRKILSVSSKVVNYEFKVWRGCCERLDSRCVYSTFPEFELARERR